MKYRADIDGLRAVAVAGVIAFHAFPNAVPGGFVGVDVFFVISGFLISTIILGEVVAAEFSFVEFYARRVRRLFPALLAVLAASLVAGWLLLFIGEFHKLADQLLAGGGFVSNILFWRQTGYFDDAAQAKPLLHLWSLGVEEQFYFLWPLLLLMTRGRTARLQWLCGTVFVASFGANLILAHHHQEAVFFLPQFRLWEFAAGAALVALRPRPATAETRRDWCAEGAALLGIAAILAAMALFADHAHYPGKRGLLPVAGAALLLATPSAWFNRRVLASPALIWLGRISYPLYLWHWPLISFLHITHKDTPPVVAGALALSLGLATLTYFLVERPLRHRPARRIAPVLLGLLFLVMAAGLAARLGILSPRLDAPQVNAALDVREDWDYPPAGATTEKFETLPVYRLRGTRDAEVLYIGDSNIEQYAPRIAAVIAGGRPTYTAAFLTRGGCLPIPGYAKGTEEEPCLDWKKTVGDYLKAHNVVRIVVGGRWVDLGPEPNLFFIFPDRTALPLTDRRAYDGLMASLDDFASWLGRQGRGVTIVQNIPVNFGGPETYALGRMRLQIPQDRAAGVAAFQPNIDRAQVVDGHSRAIVSAIAARMEFHVIDPIPALCDRRVCALTYDGTKFVYKDSAHLSAGFVRDHATFMDETILAPSEPSRP